MKLRNSLSMPGI